MWTFPWKPTGTVLLAAMLAAAMLCAAILAALLLAFQSRSATDLLPASRVKLFVSHPTREDIDLLSLYAGVGTPAATETAPEAAAVLQQDNGVLGVVLIIPATNIPSDWSAAAFLPYTVLASSQETLALAGRSTASLSWSGRFRQWQRTLQTAPDARWWYGERAAMLTVLAPSVAESLFLPQAPYVAWREQDAAHLWLTDSLATSPVPLPAARLPEATVNIAGGSLEAEWQAWQRHLTPNDSDTLLSRLEYWTQTALPGVSLRYELVPLLQHPSRLEVQTSASGSTFVWQFLLPKERADTFVQAVQTGFLSAQEEGEVRALQLGEGQSERSVRPAGSPPQEEMRQDWHTWQASDPASGRLLGIATREGHVLITNALLPATLPSQGTVAGYGELHVTAANLLTAWPLDLPWHVRLFGVENRMGMLFARTPEKAQESLGSPEQTP